ncbi:MAG: class I SAM-dependent methyltransferase [Chitinophagales bacterium]
MKKFFKYISHFWYVAINWDIRMAFFMVYDNIRGAIKYGPGTFIPIELKNLTITSGDIKKGSRYEAVSFYMLEKLFNAFRKISDQTYIIDLGCGKGRMMMVAPHFGFTHVAGIDFAEEVCEQARENMKKKEKQFARLKWNILNENVEDYDISPGDSVFFMFNPFNETVLENFLKKLNDSCDQFPRTIYFLYASPQHKKLLLDNGYAVVYQKKKMYLESIIAVRD